MDADTANGWLKAHFAPWLRALSPQVETMACTGTVLVMPVLDDVVEADGSVSGQALSALADCAMQIACAGHFRAWKTLQRTNLDMQFLQPARGESLECTATVVRPARGLIFTRAVLAVEPSGREVATATATYAVPDPA